MTLVDAHKLHDWSITPAKMRGWIKGTTRVRRWALMEKSLMSYRVFGLMKTELYNSVFITQNSKNVRLIETQLVWTDFWVEFPLLKTQNFEFESWKLKTQLEYFWVLSYGFQWPSCKYLALVGPALVYDQFTLCEL